MKKPLINEVLKILWQKDLVAKLYNELDIQIEKITEEYGEGRYDYDLEQFINAGGDEKLVSLENGRYLKFEVIDNIEKLRKNDYVVKIVAFKKIEFKLQYLKRCPASLKSLNMKN